MLAMSLAALDTTIVATAVPSIVRELGGFSQFPWVFSAYLLAIAVTTPVYGRMADIVGRKPVLMFGILLFLTGSLLCSVSWNLWALIGFRGLQGLGAGALRPLISTIAGDLYSIAERGRVQGLLSSVWGVSAVLGPAAGGLFTQFASWRWIFLVNLPVGLGALAMLFLFHHDTVPRHKVRVDYSGVLLLVMGIGLLVLGLLQGGTSWSWASAPSVIILGVAVLSLVAFVLHEQRTAEPILPPWIYRSRLLVGANLGMVALGLVTIGQSAYLPTFAQGVLGVTPFAAGLILGSQSLAWPMASALSSRLYLRFGFRDTAAIGAGLMIVAGILLVSVPQTGGLARLAIGTFVMGWGLGLVSVALMVGSQTVVDITRRGVVTGSISFSQMLGSTLSAAVFGSIYNSTFSHWLRSAPPTLAGRLPATDHALAFVQQPGTAANQLVAYVREGMYVAGHRVFWGLLVIGVVTLLVLLATPRRFEPLPLPGSLWALKEE
jgi:EmrB/QacA subfamily drug resistance transporter